MGVLTFDLVADLLVLSELMETKKTTPVIDRTYPSSDVAAAMRYLKTSRARWKVTITVTNGFAS